MELNVPYSAFGEQQIQALRSSAPEIILLDLGVEPELGLKLAQFMVEQNPGQVISRRRAGSLERAAARRHAVGDLGVPAQAGGGGGLPGRRHACRAEAPKAGGRSTASARPASWPSSAPRAGPAPPPWPPTSRSCSTEPPRSDPAGGPGPGAGRDRAAARRPAPVQLRRHGPELPPDGRRPARLVHRAARLRRPPAVRAVSAREGRGRSPATRSGGSCTFLRQHYDYVVVDTPRSFSPATLAAFEQADLVFLVTNVDLASLRNIQRGLPLLKRVLPEGRGADPPDREPLRPRRRHLAGGRASAPRAQGVLER